MMELNTTINMHIYENIQKLIRSLPFMDDKISQLRSDAYEAGCKRICGLPNSFVLTLELAELAEYPFFMETITYMDLAVLGARSKELTDVDIDKASGEQLWNFIEIAEGVIYRAGLSVLYGGLHAKLLGIEFPPKEEIPHPWTAQEEAELNRQDYPFPCHWDEL
jgi:hypothetical protein